MIHRPLGPQAWTGLDPTDYPPFNQKAQLLLIKNCEENNTVKKDVVGSSCTQGSRKIHLYSTSV